MEEVLNKNLPVEKCETDPQPARYFRCATGNWQWHIDPYGKLNICSCVREPSRDILNGDIAESVNFLSNYVRNKQFTKDSECRTCRVWHICHSCPGKAKLEVKDPEKPIPYYCELAKKESKIAKTQKETAKMQKGTAKTQNG